MGWIFGKKKKVPKVPFPEGKLFDERALQIPQKFSSDRVIEPNKIKQAVGMDQPISQPLPPKELMPLPNKVKMPLPIKVQSKMPPIRDTTAPVVNAAGEKYVKVNAYQKILGELDSLKDSLHELNHINKELHNSEYNEELNFDKLRRANKSIHDRLLEVDKILFKI
jgi:hypothetical protein